MSSHALKTIAQSTLKTHWSRYLTEVYKGKCVTRVKDQANKKFMVICQEDDAPEHCVSIKSSEARRLLSEVCWQVKTGVAFRIENKSGKALVLRPFRRYENALGESIRAYWAERVATEFREELVSTQENQNEKWLKIFQAEKRDRDEQIDKIQRLVWHAARAAYGMEVPNRDQLDRDLRPDSDEDASG